MKDIQDFGEKIGGAKKDLWIKRGLNVEDLKDLTVKEYLQYVTKNNIWRVPDWKEFDDGRPRVCIYYMKYVRDKLKANMEIFDEKYAMETAEEYVRFIMRARDLAYEIKTDQDIMEYHDILMAPYYARDGLRVYMKKNSFYIGFVFDKVRELKISSISTLDRFKSECEIQGFPDDFRGDLKGVNVRKLGSKYYIYKGKKQLLGDVFLSREEAIKYVKEEYVHTLDSKKKVKKVSKLITVVRPQLEHIERVGPDVRGGRDADGDTLIDMFGFRGGEFGNWNNNSDRQACLNYAYDSFMDLAKIIGLPLMALSLGEDIFD